MSRDIAMAGVFARVVAEYGYVAAFMGTLVEGESFLLLPGLAAQHGLLHLPILFVVAAAGAVLSDNLFFALGRALGPVLLARFPRLVPAVARADILVERFPKTAVVGVRFLYGMRAVGPAVIGAGSMAWSRFAALDALAASLWGCCWIGAGYVLGEAVEQLPSAFAQIGRWSIVGVVFGAAIALFVRRGRRRRTTAASRSAKVQ